MLTGELRSKIDKVWEQFWTGGLSNPITVIEQMTYLLFIRRLDDIHTQREQKASFLKKTIEQPIFQADQNELRGPSSRTPTPMSCTASLLKRTGYLTF